ncbi:GNAT family N-acetyltransferase [Chloroflexota bacterium]
MKELTYKFIENDRELEGINAVRREVFVEEQGIAASLVFSSERCDEELDVAVIYGGMVIGTARVVFPARDTAKIERMAVLTRFRNKKVGKGIIAFLNNQFKHRQVKKVILHAQHTATGFYQSCGFCESGPNFYEAGIKHIKMELRY